MLGLIRRYVRRRQAAGPITVTLWGKADCCLCDRAQAILERLAGEFPVHLEKRDIRTDPDVYEQFRYIIPVVEIQGGPRFEGKITEYRLRQALSRLVSEQHRARP